MKVLFNPIQMSEEQLKAFIAKVQADKSLQEQLNAEGADAAEIAKSAGFSITATELNSHRQSLSDQELEGVTGGGNCSTLEEFCPWSALPGKHY